MNEQKGVYISLDFIEFGVYYLCWYEFMNNRNFFKGTKIFKNIWEIVLNYWMKRIYKITCLYFYFIVLVTVIWIIYRIKFLFQNFKLFYVPTNKFVLYII